MTSGWNATRQTITGLLLAGAASALLPSPAAAQDDEARLRRIESQINALQRTVFPGGDGRYFTPEVDTSKPQTQTPTIGTPSSTALTDMLTRLDALESRLAQLTARTEENANHLAQLEAQLKEVREGQAGQQVAIAPPTGIIPLPSENRDSRSSVTRASAPARASTATPTPGPVEPRDPTARGAPTSTSSARSAPSASRLAAVQAIAKPSTDDAGDDEYSYGFRLWDAGFYPEAQQQLSLFLQKYPDHSRASYGRNLLGRALLDDGKPREAAAQFLENYQKDKNGARAADSLLFLSEAMVSIGDTDRACIALAEFSETYPGLATGRLKEQYDRDRSKVTCR
jgi:TolA-binding protein